MSLPISEIVKKLPSCWWGLFGAIRCPKAQAVEIWFHNQAMSHYGCLPDWDGLLLGLAEEEPCCQNKSLQYYSRFVQLPADIQCHVLNFLLRHRDDMPLPSLREFIAKTSGELLPDSWSEVLMRSLSAYVQMCSLNAPKSLMDVHYSFTGANRNKSLELCENLKSSDNNIWNLTMNKVSENSSKQKLIKESNSIEFQQNDGDSIRLHEKTDQLDITCRKEDISHSSGSQEVIVLDDEEPEIKRCKRNSDYSQETTIHQPIEIEDVDPDILTRVEKLKESWLSGLNSSSDIEVFLAVSPQQVLNVCRILQLEELPETALVVACENLCNVSSVISISNCVQFLSSTVYHKVKELSQSASRHLSGVISLCAKSFAKPLVDGVLVLCFRECLGVPQAELICKLIREVLPMSACVSLLQEIVTSEMECLDDNSISVFQALIDTKINLSDVLLTDFLRTLSSHSQSHRKNLKFGKLLAGIINKYCEQITKEQKEILMTETQSHGTFLKKSLMVSLKKISD